MLFSEFCSISALSCSFEFVWVVVVPSDYFVSSKLQLLLFCCRGCGCCWAVTIVIQPGLELISTVSKYDQYMLIIFNSAVKYRH